MSKKILTAVKKCLILVIIQLSQNTTNDSNKLVLGKMKDETGGVPIDEFVGLKSKFFSLLVDDNSENKKAKSVNCCCNNKS